MSAPRHTVSAIARLADCPESYVRFLEKRGIVSPDRDSTGRRLYAPGDAQKIREHRAAAARGRNAA
jgi:DNA-binding transcriptional MerR regulator